jgi:Enterobacter phage Enc34, ssDNA-binding protein
MTKLITPIFQAKYTDNVFKPFEDTDKDGKKYYKYSLCAIWDPKKFSDADKIRWKKIMEELEEISQKQLGKAWKNLPDNIRKGIRDGEEKEGKRGFTPSTKFATLSTFYAPGVIKADAQRTIISLEDGNTNEIYAGCYCRATVIPKWFANKTKGIRFQLNNLMKVADGESILDIPTATEDFSDIDDQIRPASDYFDEDLGF